MSPRDNKNIVLAISTVVGAALGFAAGLVLLKRVEDQDRPALTAGEGMSLGLMLLGLFRQLSQLGEDAQEHKK